MKIKYVVSYDEISLVFFSNLLSKLAQAVTIVTCIGCFFPYLTDKRRPDALVSFIRLSKGYYHSDRLSCCSSRLFKLTDTRHTM